MENIRETELTVYVRIRKSVTHSTRKNPSTRNCLLTHITFKFSYILHITIDAPMKQLGWKGLSMSFIARNRYLTITLFPPPTLHLWFAAH